MIHNLQVGDIVLVHRRFCPVAWLIRKYSGSHYNHAMMAVDGLHVVEMKSLGVKINPIAKYDNPFLYDFKVLRVVQLSDDEKTRLKRYAYQGKFVGSYWNFVRSMVGFVQKRRMFQWSCCNFVNYLFERADIWLTDHSIYTTPKHIEDSYIVREVKPIRIGDNIYGRERNRTAL